jgi:hypothetical protein
MDKVSLMGQKLTRQMIDKLEQKGYRVQEPGYGYTEEYAPFRTNIVLNEEYVVIHIYNG